MKKVTGKYSRYIFGFCIFIIISINFLSAQMLTPVKWQFKVETLNDSVADLQMVATIEKNWHLYAMTHNNGIELPIVFTFEGSENYKLLGKTREQTPEVHYDPDFGDTSRYFIRKATFKQKIQILSNQPFDVKGKIEGQACIEGRCVPVEQQAIFSISGFENMPTPDSTDAVFVSRKTDSLTVSQEFTKNISQSETLAQKTTEQESWWRFFLTAMLGGILGLLMPCVFPMIPMTVSYFMKSKNPKMEATLYGTSIVVIFVLIGIVLSLIFGAGFANILSTHWIPNLLFALIFIVFAISLFGYFDITLPSKWVNGSARMEKRGGVAGIFFMALTLVLVSFSCTLPIAGAVALHSADGSFLKPVVGMLGFALGIAIPFTFFAYFPEVLKKIGKSGNWMNTLKVTLAFVELAFALKFINVPDQTYHWGILDREVYLALWIVLFSMLGFYLLGKIRFPHDTEMPYQKSWVRYFLSIGVFAFVVYLIPGMFGAPLKAISGWLPPTTTQDFDIHNIIRNETHQGAFEHKATLSEHPRYADHLDLPHGIEGYFDYHQALNVARRENKPLFIDFTGHGCVNCRNVEAAVWVDSRVRAKFADELVVACLYVDDKTVELLPEDQIKDMNGEWIKMLGKKNMFLQQQLFRENSQPCYFVVNHDGHVLSGPVYYERDADKYLKFLDEGIEKFKQAKK
ncbi:MAG: thioredoxin family protein [Bacteroidales bacterium]|jgi:thiol:disulfide interchange protein DsbD|nr:thioredoxin family protein [Bacteroidales bacterium]